MYEHPSERLFPQDAPRQRISLNLTIHAPEIFIIGVVALKILVEIIVQHLADRSGTADARAAVDEQRAGSVDPPNKSDDLIPASKSTSV